MRQYSERPSAFLPELAWQSLEKGVIEGLRESYALTGLVVQHSVDQIEQFLVLRLVVHHVPLKGACILKGFQYQQFIYYNSKYISA